MLINSWEFTWRVARRLRLRSPETAIVKYVAPQVWATRPGRGRVLARLADHLLTLLDFEAPYFERAGLPTTFVGNPTLSRDLSGADPARDSAPRSRRDRTIRSCWCCPAAALARSSG